VDHQFNSLIAPLVWAWYNFAQAGFKNETARSSSTSEKF